VIGADATLNQAILSRVLRTLDRQGRLFENEALKLAAVVARQGVGDVEMDRRKFDEFGGGEQSQIADFRAVPLEDHMQRIGGAIGGRRKDGHGVRREGRCQSKLVQK
jgi:hypothetical protein